MFSLAICFVFEYCLFGKALGCVTKKNKPDKIIGNKNKPPLYIVSDLFLQKFVCQQICLLQAGKGTFSFGIANQVNPKCPMRPQEYKIQGTLASSMRI